MKRRQSPRHGFTLLEILVALVIFVGSVAVISRLVSLGLDNADYARLQGEGVLLVESKFAEIDAGMEEGEGSSGDSFPGWTTEAGNESVGNFLYRITVTARHTTGANVAMTRFFFDEEEAEEAMAQRKAVRRARRRRDRQARLPAVPAREDRNMRLQLVRRTGYTFLEVILALGLSLILVAGIYSAVQMTYQQWEVGRQAAEEAQVVRALFQRIRTDLNATMTTWTPPAAPQAASSSTPGAATGASGSTTGGATSGSATTGGSTTAARRRAVRLVRPAGRLQARLVGGRRRGAESDGVSARRSHGRRGQHLRRRASRSVGPRFQSEPSGRRDCVGDEDDHLSDRRAAGFREHRRRRRRIDPRRVAGNARCDVARRSFAGDPQRFAGVGSPAASHHILRRAVLERHAGTFCSRARLSAFRSKWE